jgi:hypothetical protein
VPGPDQRPKDFGDLLRILDGEVRLITPTDPEGKDDADTSTVQAGEKYYQLTHDFLVPSLRDWLTRKRKETRRGRAPVEPVRRLPIHLARRPIWSAGTLGTMGTQKTQLSLSVHCGQTTTAFLTCTATLGSGRRV